MEKIEDDLTYRIIGCAMKVHAALGNGFQEVIMSEFGFIGLKDCWID
jgi:hypothetical protein